MHNSITFPHAFVTNTMNQIGWANQHLCLCLPSCFTATHSSMCVILSGLYGILATVNQNVYCHQYCKLNIQLLKYIPDIMSRDKIFQFSLRMYKHSVFIHKQMKTSKTLPRLSNNSHNFSVEVSYYVHVACVGSEIPERKKADRWPRALLDIPTAGFRGTDNWALTPPCIWSAWTPDLQPPGWAHPTEDATGSGQRDRVDIFIWIQSMSE